MRVHSLGSKLSPPFLTVILMVCIIHVITGTRFGITHNSMASYKILALDGGGSWAILQAMALGKLYGYDTPGQTILNKFFLAAANSGGSIILAGLALNFTPRDLMTKLNDQSLRQEIFVKNLYALQLLGIDVEKYKADAKLAGLKTIMQQAPDGAKCNQPLDQIGLTCKLLIPAFNYDRQRTEFFRSDPASPAALVAGAPQPTLAEAVHGSTNAPIKFFNAPAQFESAAFNGRRYWDGAMGGFNNPVLAAVTEAITYGYAPTDLRVLSIGTGTVLLPMPNPLPQPGASGQSNLNVQIKPSGLFHDAAEILPTLILDDPPDAASYTVHVITGEKLVRMNPSIQPIGTPGAWQVPALIKYAPDPTTNPPNTVPTNYHDDAGVFNALMNLGIDAVNQADVDLITTLGRSWIAGAAPNQAIRTGPDLQPLIGCGTFAEAVAQAKSLGLVPSDTDLLPGPGDSESPLAVPVPS